MFVDLGAVLVDTDAIARSLTAVGGAALAPIARAFGADTIGPDGALDRERMRSIAFGDVAQRHRLETILHPMIGDQALREAAQAGDQPVVFDVPLLTESSVWRLRVARVVVVDCLESTQVQRVMKRSGWSREAVERVIGQQASRSARRRVADAVIYNEDLELSALRTEVEQLWDAWVTGGNAVGRAAAGRL